jgi:tRNA-modifying protein YgfZ
MHHQLSELALFDVTGQDAASFLQGQLTQDMLTWQTAEIKRAAWCNVKGRMLASFYLWQIEGGFRLLVAQDLTVKVLPRLRMFVMRAKVVVSEPLNLPLYACRSALPALSNDGTVFSLLPSGFAVSTNPALANADDWTLAHIQAGTAWVSADNTEQFVPQTANFELVGGINFRKGCYPGQEIVARSQYLGKLKQRAAIAQIKGSAKALDDVFEAKSPNPVGRVIQAAGAWALFDAPHALIEAGKPLHLGSPSGELLAVQALPYPVLDITA